MESFNILSSHISNKIFLSDPNSSPLRNLHWYSSLLFIVVISSFSPVPTYQKVLRISYIFYVCICPSPKLPSPQADVVYFWFSIILFYLVSLLHICSLTIPLSKEMSVILQKWKYYIILSFGSAIIGSIKSKNLCFEFSELLPFPLILYHCPYWPDFSQFGLLFFHSSKVQGTWSLLFSLHDKFLFLFHFVSLALCRGGGIFLILLVLRLTRPESTFSEKAFQTNISRMVHSRITLYQISS